MNSSFWHPPREKMRPLIEMINKAALALLPVTVVVAGAIIQIASALLQASNPISLGLVWASAGCFALTLLATFFFQSSVPEKTQQAFSKETNEERLWFFVSLAGFGFGVGLFLLSPVGILTSQNIRLQAFLGTQNITMQSTETLSVGVMAQSDKEIDVDLYLRSSDGRLQVSPAVARMDTWKNQVATTVIEITASDVLPPGTYVVVLVFQPVGRPASESRIENITVTVLDNVVPTAQHSVTPAPTLVR